MAAGSDSSSLTEAELEADLHNRLLDEALEFYGTDLPPFIQTNLDPSIKPGDQHQAIPMTNTGSFPSVKSTKRVPLVCHSWNNNAVDRFWTYDHSNVRYIVKAFPTNAEPKDIPKISYHVWKGVSRNFQKLRVAYDADKRLYQSQPDEMTNHQESASTDTKRPRQAWAVVRPSVGSTDSNKGLRTCAELVHDVEDQMNRSKSKGTGTSDPRKGAYLEQDLARVDDDDNDDEELKKPSSHSAQADTTIPYLAKDDFKPKAENTKDAIHSSLKAESKELGRHKGKAKAEGRP